MKCDKNIYGCDPDGGAKAAASEALRRMGTLSVTDKAAKSDGPDVSDTKDMADERAKP